jgi:RNA recognition motif-containing protein
MIAVATVFVNGFDFGTTEGDLEAHMSGVGTVVSIQMKKGNAVVTYSSPAEAQKAVKEYSKSTIPGNSRFIDVQLDKKSMPAKPGMKRSFEGGEGGSPKVLVRGFDFDTTDEQLTEHMGSVGSIEAVHWVSKGSANVTYSNSSEATAAINTLDHTTLPGNTRYIEVIPGGDLAAKRFKGGGKGDFKGGFEMCDSGKGGTWAFIPAGGKGKGFSSAPWHNLGKGKGKGGGKSQKNRDHSDEDPAGSGRVFVRGFDFGTTDEQLELHMKKAGPIHTVHWVNKGNAVVVYKKKVSADKAIATLNQTTIPGNSRYIDITLRQ